MCTLCTNAGSFVSQYFISESVSMSDGVCERMRVCVGGIHQSVKRFARADL